VEGDGVQELKRRVESAGNSPQSVLLRCAKAKECLPDDWITCEFCRLPTKRTGAYVDKSEEGGPYILLCANAYGTMGHEEIRVSSGEELANVTHELVHASQCEKEFFSDDACLQALASEIRAYWYERKCNCEEVCRDAWGSAKGACYQALGADPKSPAQGWKDWFERREKWWAAQERYYLWRCRNLCLGHYGFLLSWDQPYWECRSFLEERGLEWTGRRWRLLAAGTEQADVYV
jgi:hypothetical protein